MCLPEALVFQVLDTLACENVEAERPDISSINLCRCSYDRVASQWRHQGGDFNWKNFKRNWQKLVSQKWPKKLSVCLTSGRDLTNLTLDIDKVLIPISVSELRHTHPVAVALSLLLFLSVNLSLSLSFYSFFHCFRSKSPPTCVTWFRKISPLWQNFKSIRPLLEGIFSIWPNVESILAYS